jgi:hypothetical protein
VGLLALVNALDVGSGELELLSLFHLFQPNMRKFTLDFLGEAVASGYRLVLGLLGVLVSRTNLDQAVQHGKSIQNEHDRQLVVIKVRQDGYVVHGDPVM